MIFELMLIINTHVDKKFNPFYYSINNRRHSALRQNSHCFFKADKQVSLFKKSKNNAVVTRYFVGEVLNVNENMLNTQGTKRLHRMIGFRKDGATYKDSVDHVRTFLEYQLPDDSQPKYRYVDDRFRCLERPGYIGYFKDAYFGRDGHLVTLSISGTNTIIQIWSEGDDNWIMDECITSTDFHDCAEALVSETAFLLGDGCISPDGKTLVVIVKPVVKKDE